MSGRSKLLAFLVALAAVFAAAVGVGGAVGPVAAAPAADHGDMAGTDPAAADATALPKGLTVSQDGYAFRLEDTAVEDAGYQLA